MGKHQSKLKRLFSKESLPSLCVAVIALLFSAISCIVSVRAVRIQEQLQAQHQLVTLIGTLNEAGDEMSLQPAQAHATLQEAQIIYPPEFSTEPWDIDPPNYTHPLVSPLATLRSIVEQSVKRSDRYYMMLDGTGIPVLIDVYYIVDGIPQHGRGLYRIPYKAYLSDKANTPVKVEFQGLIFMSHFDYDGDHRKLLSNIWQGMVKEWPELPQDE